MAQQHACKTASSLQCPRGNCLTRRLRQTRNVLVARTAAILQGREAPADIQLLRDSAQRFIGPVRVCEIDGKGRGVVATDAVAPGQLLLCCNPLGVVTGPQQASLTVEELQVSLASNYSSSTHLWLSQLYDGSEASAHQELQFQQQQQQQLEVSSGNGHQLCPLTAAAAGYSGNGGTLATNSTGHVIRHSTQHPRQQQHTGHEHTCSSSSSGGGGNENVPAVTDAVLTRLMDVVRYNAYGDRHDDLAAAALTGAEPVALLGLWPEFSMLNHSCVPNAINWVLPGVNRAMAVRAARHIQAGDEVTISYLGGPQLLPLDARHEALSNTFGFKCSCPRCQAEEDIPGSLTELVHDTVGRVGQSFAPQLQRAVKAGDTRKLQEVRRQAAATMTLLYQQFRRHLVHPVLREQLLASCYNCLEVIADVDAVLGDAAAEAVSLAKCLKAAAAVTPGSDLHVIVASKLAAVQQHLHGQGSSQAQQAWQDCAAAHNLRYGKLGAEIVKQLAELNRTLYV